MSKPIKRKFEDDEIITKVVSSATIASAGIANGRNIPVVIVESDNKNKINDLLKAHESVKNGNCASQFGFIEGYQYAMLILDFSLPIEITIVLLFDVIKQGITVDQILYSKCMYLMTGDEKTKFSLNMDKPRILLEITTEGFQPHWNKIYKKKYSKYLKKKYSVTKKDSEKLFDKIRKEHETLKKIRM